MNQTLRYSTRELLQHWTEPSRIPALRKRSVWRKWKLKKKTASSEEDRLLDLRVLPGHWSQRFCRELRRPIYCCSSKWWYSGIRFEMGRIFIIDDANPIWWNLGKLVQIKNTSVWETQDRIGTVHYGDLSEESWTWLSQIEEKEESNKIYVQIFISTNSLHQPRLLAGRYDSRLRYVLVHNVLRKLCIGSKKWRWLIQWMIYNRRYLFVVFECQILEVLDAEIASELNRIIHNSHFKRTVSLEGQKAQKQDPFPSRETDRLPDLRVLPGHWSQRFCRALCRPIHYQSSKWWFSGIRFEMGRNSIINDENPIWWHLGNIVQIKNTSVWETQDRIGIVQYGDSSEESWTWLSQIEDNGKKQYRTEFANEEFWGQKRTLWKERRGQESGDKTAWTTKSRRLLAMESQRAVSERRQLQFPTRYEWACKIDTAEFFSKIFYAAECEKCIENPKSQRKESQW